MQKAKKNFADSRSSRNRNLNRLNDELQGVQKIMIQNIDDVLQRGENLSGKLYFKIGVMNLDNSKLDKSINLSTFLTIVFLAISHEEVDSVI